VRCWAECSPDAGDCCDRDYFRQHIPSLFGNGLYRWHI
jgi:hypothetical protein